MSGSLTFKCDPLGRRIEKTTSSTTSIYAYDGDDLIEETNASGGVVARYTHTTDKIDEPAAMLRNATTSYYETNGIGTVTSLSNSAGALAETYTCDSFGNTTNSSGSVTNPFQYSAREFDSETGLYYLRARYLDPTTGRFLSEDPIQFSGGINFYRYVDKNAVNETDPQGTGYVDCADALKKLAQATARVAGRTAAIAAHGGRPDPGHAKALRHALNQLNDALDKVKKHCGCVVALAAEVAIAVAAAEAAEAAAAAALAAAAAG